MKHLHLLSLEHSLEIKDFICQGKLLSVGSIAKSLRDKTNLRHSFEINGLLYVYNPAWGIYICITEKVLVDELVNIFSELEMDSYIKKGVLLEVAWILIARARKDIEIDYRHVTFRNGHYSLETDELLPTSPEIPSITFLDTDYRTDIEPTLFKELLDLQFDQDTQNYFRAFVWSILHGDTEAQVFLYLYGPGGTGKSTLVNLLTMLVGEEATLTTTLRDLQQDKFEGANLTGKRLICINDTETFKGDLYVLKAITGGDSIIGRTKHASGSFEVRPHGRLVITGNVMLQTRDASGALDRRMRVLPMEVSPEKIKTYLIKKGGKWVGPLVKETPAIMRWARMKREEAIEVLRGPLPPQMERVRVEAHHHMNPLLKWVSEACVLEGGAYVGFSTETSYEKVLLSARKHLTLYPAYALFCLGLKIKPLSHNRFSEELIKTCQYMQIDVKRVRKREGTYIEGIRVNPEMLTTEMLSGAPLPVETPQLPEFRDFSSTSYDIVEPNLYDKYIKKLKDTARSWIGKQLNKWARTEFRVTPQLLAREHVDLCSGLKDLKVKVPGLDYDFGKPSKDYEKHYMQIYRKAIDVIHKSGMVPLNYKPMGNSPRILPQSYGDSFNSVKKSLRYRVYQECVQDLKEDLTILDVDLKSCYTSIILGLFPQKLYYIRQAIEGPGLWKHMENEFEQSGKKTLFNKPAVKICLYSSFFGGGPNAMVNSTMDFMRKEIGRTVPEFKKADYYEALHALARDVAEFVNGTDTIKDFREVSDHLLKTYNGTKINGPTGQQYVVSEKTFQTSYPNFLQSFEFFLLAQATLMTLQHLPQAYLIGHYHDGNVVILKPSLVEQYESEMNRNLAILQKQLNLYYPQTIEIKRFEKKLQ